MTMRHDIHQDEALGTELLRVNSLVSDEGGLINAVQQITSNKDPFAIFTATLGALERLQKNIRVAPGSKAGIELAGSGGGTNRQLARAIAIVEAVERYSSCVPPTDLHWASAAELGREAVDIGSLPRCSATELADSRCPVRPFDSAERIRWTTAWSSRRQELLWIPATLVWMHLEALTASERLTVPISTGCAAHTDPAQALLNGVCEVVERDAIALTWLLRLKLPEIDLVDAPAHVREAVAVADSSGRRHRFFDATTDTGIPTIYCVDTDEESLTLRHVVMCSTELDPARAIVKIVREIASSRIALENAGPAPADIADFHSVTDGARFMGHPDRAAAFSFLLDDDRPRIPFSSVANLDQTDPKASLIAVVARLQEAGCDVLSIDISTVEAQTVGLTVVRVVVPELMPLSFAHRARYLAHQRLHDVAHHLGRGALDEADLNPYPQPFA
ncbi:YcaO-like family protein [Rathayibacter tritici]|uniref:Cytoplasmic protein n=1 Tax=Rathayibacter tritici TaxID=33888 RepID=A0A160KUH8_9MICO|nr:YcaO-like family protein [Rathayibacter tritici]AND17570.1 cytoplasmic protein [Rathayibacter tritici]PPI49971.1 cytoplasmic protein [Rathayibacter tritici]